MGNSLSLSLSPSLLYLFSHIIFSHLAKDIAADNLKRFINGEAKYLVSTNLLSRGLDFVNVRHIIQFEFASNKIEHLHRIGR